jgi:CRP-like cAMP-binding protein
VESLPSCAAAVPVFRILPRDGMEALAEAMRHRRFRRGEIVASAGATVQHLIVVAEGQLKLVRTSAAGREQVVSVLGPGDFTGELALFTTLQLEGDLVAVGETSVCMVARDAVQGILRQYPGVALALVEALAQRLAQAEQTIADLGLRDVGQRLAAALLREAEVAGGDEVNIAVPWSEMAYRLGTTPESLSRRLRALVDQGVVRQVGPRTVVIQDHEQLREMAEL